MRTQFGTSIWKICDNAHIWAEPCGFNNPQETYSSMNREEHKWLCNRLNKPSDIVSLANSTGHDEELLLVLYTHKATKNATRMFYRVKNKVGTYLNKWKGGRSFYQISQDLDFPPVLTAFLILGEDGLGRKTFWKYVRDPDCIKDKRLQLDIMEIVEKDILYSPAGNEVQRQRGIVGEERLSKWLDGYGITYRTENDLKDDDEFTKTPDVLLDHPLNYKGTKIYWIESKASFGDESEIRKNVSKQLRPYVELFGPGIVVYWFGRLDEIPDPEGIFIKDETFFMEEKSYPFEHEEDS